MVATIQGWVQHSSHEARHSHGGIQLALTAVSILILSYGSHRVGLGVEHASNREQQDRRRTPSNRNYIFEVYPGSVTDHINFSHPVR